MSHINTMLTKHVAIPLAAAVFFASAADAHSSHAGSDDEHADATATPEVILWDVVMGLAMCVIALIGAAGLLIPKHRIGTFTRPLIAFAAGALLGGALLHMLPSAVVTLGTSATPYAIATLGFCVFLAVEETIHWLYNRGSPKTENAEATSGCEPEPAPVAPTQAPNADTETETELSNMENGVSKPTLCQQVRVCVCEGSEPCACPSHHLDRSKLALAWLILVGDGLHNFFGGLSIGATYMFDGGAGWAAWVAAALHEIPQELADFAVLVHAGLDAKKALLYNFVAALPFLLGMVLSAVIGADVCKYFIPFGAGNFLYIGATALLPEVHHQKKPRSMLVTFACFMAGIALLLAVRIAFDGW